MRDTVSLIGYQPSPVHDLGSDFSGTGPSGEHISFNSYFMERDGMPFFPVSGEIHYSRMDPRRWEDEIIKMRMGGVNIVSTYVFWNHVEEEEGSFDFTGRRDLRRFVQLCAKHGMYVILRIGPFAHGEVRNGGIPDWMYGKPYEVRSLDPEFLACVHRLYAQLGEQMTGLFHENGGPIIGMQLDNEYMHAGAGWEITTGISNEWLPAGSDGEAYILKLREMALECGMRPAFFTGTAWGGAAYSPRVLPLWGGYAYRPWIFYSHSGEHPATEEYVYEDYHHNGVKWGDDFAPPYAPEDRPYACCEMGAGMMCCYYYRFIYPYRSVDALANIKLGSGCNFLGYYMFHGGTNPLGRHGTYLNESQVPKLSYDYQAALGEFGQVRESYSRLKTMHFLTRFFGQRLAPMETILPEGASAIEPTDLDTLRYAVRSDGESGFLFINNFQDHRNMPAKTHRPVRVETRSGVYDFDISIAADENAVLPFHFDMDGIMLEKAYAQPVLRTLIGERITYVFMVPDGMDGALWFEDGADLSGRGNCFTVKKDGRQVDILLLTRHEADTLFLLRDGSLVRTEAALLEDEAGALRLESTEAENRVFCYPAHRLEGRAERLEDDGVWGVYRTCAEEKQIPVQCTPAAPFRWRLKVPERALEGLKDARLQIRYRGDIGMLFMNDRMISDNFCNGDVWEIGLMEHEESLDREMVLKIAPLREGAKVNVESAMAARNEEVRSNTGELLDVRVQPVYEICL